MVRIRCVVVAVGLVCGVLWSGWTGAADLPETRLRVVGGLAGVNQFTRHELPFWTKRIKERSNGRITAEVLPFDQGGLRGQEMPRLLSLGVVPFGTMILSLATEDPELAAADLPLLNPDFAALRRSVGAYRPVIRRLLRERYDLELLAVYAYPAQVLYCRGAFHGLGDLKGRRIRTSGVAQAELVEALGAIPVVTPFAEIVGAVQRDVVDCAITGTMSGNGIGLHEETTHVHELAVTWGLSVFVANGGAWAALPAPVRDFLLPQIAGLEAEIWDSAERDTGEGLACNAGERGCASGRRGRMVRVPVSAEDAARARALIADVVLPGWLGRCGDGCAAVWNASLGPLLSIPAPVPPAGPG
ncbi:MAG TPA: TRAP transporter substrate-binding protein [Azospirillum sp.]|nr:TRAP transporter substrate-binding protein [Azospirillum sp.]